MKKAVFFDRDGTLIEEKNYIKSPDDVFLIDGVKTTIQTLKDRGYLIFVVSNQSGIARGYLSKKDFDSVNEKMLELIGKNLIDDISFCPHHPNFTGVCSCRKPEPKMVLDLAKKYDINLKKSYIVGDKLSDILLVNTAGMRCGFLVKSGYGSDEIGRIPDSIKNNIKIIENFEDMLKFL